MSPKLLVVAGSLRTGSYNVRLSHEAARLLAATDAIVTVANLADYPLPIYDADHEAEHGVPQNAQILAQRLAAQDALLLVSPEYNASIPPLVKNTLDWTSRVRTVRDSPVRPFAGLVVGLAGASPSAGGGRGASAQLRQLFQSLGAEIVSAQCNVAAAHEAFDGEGRLVRERDGAGLERLVGRLVDHARALGRHG